MRRGAMDGLAGALFAVIVAGGAQLVDARFGETWFWAVVGGGVLIACAALAARPSLVATPFAAWVGATCGVLAAPLLASSLSPPSGPAPASTQTLDALVEMSQGDPLIAVATAWHPVRSAAVSGSWTVGPRLEPGRTYSLVALASTHGADGVPPTAADERRFTREAFTRAWRSVDEEGVLAWLATDEAIFARGVAQIAEVVATETREVVPLANRGFALRVTEGAPRTPYRFLLLVSRGAFGAEEAMRLSALAHGLPVRVLFGTGVPARGAWGAFADPRGPSLARDVLRLDLSRRAGRWLDLTAATADRPVFLRIDEVASPATRATVGAATVGLLALLLLPMRRRRRMGAADAPAWPVALSLAVFAAAGAAPFFAIAALAGRTVALGGRAIVDPAVAIAAALVGFAGGAHVRNARAATALALAGAAAAAALRLALGSLVSGPFAAEASREIVLALAAGLFGLAAAAPSALSRARLSETMPDALPWALRAQGVAAFGAAAATPWLVHWKGFAGVWVAATLAYLLTAAAPSLLPGARSERA
ncbi:MAG: hypothetical protein U0167_12760 [bacterium]